MSSLRDLVIGNDACTASDGAGPSNALSSLVDNLLGSGKAQEQLQEHGVHRLMPGGEASGEEMAKAFAGAGQHLHIPGLAGPPAVLAPHDQLEKDVAAFMEAQWMQHPEFDRIFHQQLQQPGMDHTRRLEMLHSAFASFLRSGELGASPWHAPALPDVALSIPEQCRVRDRTTIMARHVFADRGDEFADAQVNSLLSSLNINPHALPAEAEHRSEAWEALWAARHPPEPLAAEAAAADGMAAAVAVGAESWVQDFHKQPAPQQWAEEFHSGAPWVQEFSEPGGSWAEQFKTAQATSDLAASSREVSDADALLHTRQLAETLAKDKDPKFQNSKFLQFVSKMSRGELVMENNKVVEKSPAEVGASWAEAFSRQQSEGDMMAAWSSLRGVERTPSTGWAEEFAGPALGDDQYFDQWVEQFAQEGGPKPSAFGDDWLEEYQEQMSRLNVDDGMPVGVEEYDYKFAENNPFLEDPEPLARGKELFRTGVLSEAALALEAAVQRDSTSVEGWRLLGTVHAENDDDKQAIKAMMQALKAGPEDTEVMLSLGVSFTNELDQIHALGHLHRWLRSHPVHGPMAAAAASAGGAADLHGTIDMFEAALEASPQDAEIASALGVLYNLSRDWDGAVRSFRHALEIQPNDYSLWNKLGATLANSSRSGEALSAYQKALDLKPNYMRAWTNLGISYSNLGKYIEAAKYYLQALELNPSAVDVWSYLKTAVLCAGRTDLMPSLSNSDLRAIRAGLLES